MPNIRVEAETVHARNYLKAIRGVHGIRENVQEAILVESRAFKSVYPEKAPPSTCLICGITDPEYKRIS